jgi:hypothetical protein
MTGMAPFAPEARRGEGLGMRGLSHRANQHLHLRLETRTTAEPGQAPHRFLENGPIIKSSLLQTSIRPVRPNNSKLRTSAFKLLFACCA